MLENTFLSPTHDHHKPLTWSMWVFRALYIFGAFWVIVILTFNIFRPIKVLPRVTLAPGFAFTNQAGEHKTSEDYRGKVTLYNFTYSHCGSGCPQTSAQMESLRAALNQSHFPNLKLAMATISLDPARDTPDVLNTYARSFPEAQQSDIPWDFLVGGKNSTKYVVGGGFGIYYETVLGQGGDYSLQYEPRFVLVDGWGIIRAEYHTASLDIPAVIRDIGYLDTEVQNSHGVARYAYEAAHLFKCYR